ncbi:MAG: pyridoxal-phosphate dependent enzyme [Flavobacteriales bacterium]
MNYYDNILQAIGNTPLVKLNNVAKEIPGTVLAKVETMNPGNSVKDRIAIQMVEDAEKEGKIKPGGTIIEGTSGNTGMGLALACIVKGYDLICTLSDKQSKEKMDILRAVGAEVIVCPAAVPPDDPRSYYSVADRLSKEIPNSFYIDQYNNLANTKAHYNTTGPEIWEQTEGQVTHFVVGVGTGGTISGVGRYLKEQNPNVKIWGIDSYGSALQKYHETGEFDPNEVYHYLTEGIGEDLIPENVDFDIIDRFEKVNDKAGALMARRISREEGLFVGNSAGPAIQGLLQLKDEIKENDVVVVLFHDHGSRYVGKIYNDDWMRDRGFLDDEQITAKDLIKRQGRKKLITLDIGDPLGNAVDEMTKKGISQIPVRDNGEIVGCLTDQVVFSKMIEDPSLKEKDVHEVMQPALPVVGEDATLEELSAKIDRKNTAVLMRDKTGEHFIITRQDIISALN